MHWETLKEQVPYNVKENKFQTSDDQHASKLRNEFTKTGTNHTKDSRQDILNGYVLNEGEKEVRSQNCGAVVKKATQAAR